MSAPTTPAFAPPDLVRAPQPESLRPGAPPAAPAPVTLPGTPARRLKPSRRWLRLVIPPAVALLLIAWTLLSHVLADPSHTNGDYLNPASSAGIGAATLAGQLNAAGVPIEVVHSSSDAVLRAAHGNVTLFLPTAELMLPSAVALLPELPSGTRIVLVRPPLLTRWQLGLEGLRVQSRWATGPAAGCALGEVPAGRALMNRDHYLPPQGVTLSAEDGVTLDCFGHALLGLLSSGPEFVLVGADDIFRNDRIGELGNAPLADALLGSEGRPVVWLDLHKKEKEPKAAANESPPPPGDDPAPSLPLPSWVNAAGVGLAVAAVLGALAAGRRLGPPVPEPLPVRVRGTETALGRGRLYRRAKARELALRALRERAVYRLRGPLNLPPDAAPADVVAQLAARTGAAPAVVTAALYGPAPTNDEELVAAVADLDTLVAAVLPGWSGPPPQPAPPPNGGPADDPHPYPSYPGSDPGPTDPSPTDPSPKEWS